MLLTTLLCQWLCSCLSLLHRMLFSCFFAGSSYLVIFVMCLSLVLFSPISLLLMKQLTLSTLYNTTKWIYIAIWLNKLWEIPRKEPEDKVIVIHPSALSPILIQFFPLLLLLLSSPFLFWLLHPNFSSLSDTLIACLPPKLKICNTQKSISQFYFLNPPNTPIHLSHHNESYFPKS